MSDIGSLVIAIVELCCLDVGHGPSEFLRTYWIEAYSLHAFTGDEAQDTEYVQNIIDQWGMLVPMVNRTPNLHFKFENPMSSVNEYEKLQNELLPYPPQCIIATPSNVLVHRQRGKCAFPHVVCWGVVDSR
ncbi:hypothetical protein BYT27DRAFT_7208476 [Phlegmacium glaucopus]|nr:hypothetical protein BYT27DRAFT_7208476 [Phlegmacium glaucopus]